VIPLPEVTNYHMRFIWRIWFFFYILFSASLVVGPLYALFDFNYLQQSIWVTVVFILIALGAMAMGAYVFWDSLEIISGKLTLLPDRMEYKSLIRKSIIYNSEMWGFQANFPAAHSFNLFPKEVIAILPQRQGVKNRKIKMSPYINNHELLLEWLQKNFEELPGRGYIDD
jgi:hypothetical protein